MNIDIIRKKNRTKKNFPRFIKQQINTHRLFFIIKQWYDSVSLINNNEYEEEKACEDKNRKEN